MAKITNIKQQVKNPDRVSVFVDGKYSFSLSAWQYGDAGLKIGAEISDQELDGFKADSDYGKFYDRTLMWLLLRPRSQWEVQDYLNRKTEDEEMRTAIYEQLVDRKYIDDEKFAHSWVNNRRLLKSVSKLKLRQELLKKRVSKEIIDQTLEEDETDETEVLKELIEKKRRITRYQDDKKLMEYLSRQGFRYGDIKTALEELES